MLSSVFALHELGGCTFHVVGKQGLFSCSHLQVTHDQTNQPIPQPPLDAGDLLGLQSQLNMLFDHESNGEINQVCFMGTHAVFLHCTALLCIRISPFCALISRHCCIEYTISIQYSCVSCSVRAVQHGLHLQANIWPVQGLLQLNLFEVRGST